MMTSGPSIDEDLIIHRTVDEKTTLCDKSVLGMEDEFGFVYGASDTEMGNRARVIGASGEISSHVCLICHQRDNEKRSIEKTSAVLSSSSE